MITAILRGGMGNQMFQYAMAFAQAKRLGVGLQLDITYTPDTESQDVKRVYMLGRWAGVTEPLVRGTNPTVYESEFPYNANVDSQIIDGDCFSGYWQTEKYFLSRASDVKRQFTLKNSMPEQVAKDAQSIQEAGERSTFLTVRRTDYVNNEFHGQMGMDYYLEALRLVSERVKPKVFVFSDDPKWCRDNFDLPYEWQVVGGERPTTLAYNGQEEYDIALTASCQHAVLANSTFSWWGAWLGEFKSGSQVIVAPKRWFANAPLDIRDIIPERWIKI